MPYSAWDLRMEDRLYEATHGEPEPDMDEKLWLSITEDLADFDDDWAREESEP